MVMKALHKQKVYFAKHVRKIHGTPDIVFRRKKVVVFIDSDFWHCNPEKFQMPKKNSEYWVPKLRKNVERDLSVNEILKSAGWTVLRLWESEIKRDLAGSVYRILVVIGHEPKIQENKHRGSHVILETYDLHGHHGPREQNKLNRPKERRNGKTTWRFSPS